jgi:hypothetical protein
VQLGGEVDRQSVEIDRQVRAAIADGRSLYAIDAALIDELRPDVEVGASIETLATRLGVPERGREVATEMREAIDGVRRSTEAALRAGVRRPRVDP